MIRFSALACTALLAALPSTLRAAPSGGRSGGSEQAWDPASDEGIPQDQLFKAADEGRAPPGSRVTRRVVAAGSSDEAASDKEKEDAEMARPKRARDRTAKPAADADADEDAAPAHRRGARRGSKPEINDGARRIQVFLVPIGQAAALAAGAAQAALEGELAHLPGYKPVDLVEELKVPPSAEETAKLEEARRLVSQGDKLLRAHGYEEAVNRYRSALRTLETAGAACEYTDRADMFARFGTALMLAGEDDPAKEAFRVAARADLAATIDGREIEKRTPAALESARQDVADGPIGALSIVTNPAGARVFLGGVYRGTTPITIDRAPAGVNYLRLDRPGAFPEVRLVEVKEGMDTPAKVKMRFTPEALELQRTLGQVPRSLDGNTGLPDMVRALGSRFRLDRALVSVVEMASTNNAQIRLCVFDFPKEARLADEKVVLATDLEGGLEAAVGTWARGVLDNADRSRNRQAKDPLDRADGTEEWYSTHNSRRKSVESQQGAEDERPEWERRGDYRGPDDARKRGVKSKDPLDHKDGMEDW